jgi:nucleotide-binding universal stress UspA family protein
MYKKILVPLDGSKLAEIALPHLEEIAKGCSIPEIMLVSVTERILVHVPVDEVSEQIPVQQFETTGSVMVGFGFRVEKDVTLPLTKAPVTMGKMARDAKNYLSEKADELNRRGFITTIDILIGDPVKEIVHFADEEGVDLIVMASWGKHGMSKWSVANVAEKVFRRTHIPMLLIKPPVDFKEDKPRRKGKPV